LVLTSLLYVLFILLPGYIAYAAAGYNVDEKGIFARIVYRGAAVFFIINALALAFSGSQVSKAYFKLFQNTPENMDNRVFVYTIAVYILGGFILGWLQLYLEYKTLWNAKRDLKKWVNKKSDAVEVEPGNILKRILICYRFANKKPFVVVYFDKDKNIEGEVLKYCWNGREELLLRHADTCELFVLDLGKCISLNFKNIHELDNMINVKKSDINLLDLIHGGLSEAIKEKNKMNTPAE